jgi:hypothetical protein
MVGDVRCEIVTRRSPSAKRTEDGSNDVRLDHARSAAHIRSRDFISPSEYIHKASPLSEIIESLAHLKGSREYLAKKLDVFLIPELQTKLHKLLLHQEMKTAARSMTLSAKVVRKQVQSF